MLSSAADFRRVYSNISGKLVVAAATGDTTLVTAKSTNNTIYIQRVIFYVTTNAAQSMSFEDSTAVTPFQLANIPSSPGDDTRWDFDFGDEGMPLTEGKNFVMNVSAAGLAGNLHWEGYEKRTAVGAP